MDKTAFKELRLTFQGLSVYRELLKDEVIKKLQELTDYLASGSEDLEEFVKLFNDFYSILIRNNSTNTLRDYVIRGILLKENIFSICAQKDNADEIDEKLKAAVSEDLNYLQVISAVSSGNIKRYALDRLSHSEFEKMIVANLPEWEFSENNSDVRQYTKVKKQLESAVKWGNCVKDIEEFHRQNGSGIFSEYAAFVWDGENGYLKGIECPDPVRLGDLSGYEMERRMIIENTAQFLKGYKGNNVLLYGDRGTGKSSTVKALLNEYWKQGLRMIEIPKNYLRDLAKILEIIRGRKQKFILFIDDLVFGDNEESYTSLKAILEGGLEARPDNVVIYATSNRRHLIKEKFSDRQGTTLTNQDEEIRSADTMQEKLSLADRFGITLTFTSPDKLKYLKIVEDIAIKRGLAIDREILSQEALKWEIRYNGRSPRTAKQFIDWMEGQHQ